MHDDVTRSIDDAVAGGVPFVIAGTTSASKTTFLHAAGRRGAVDDDMAEAAASDTVIGVYSVTKAFTTTVALQCVEDGILNLDAPAREYLPAIGELEVLEDLDDDGRMRTRPPVRDITSRMLLMHTSGLAYDMFDPRYAALARARRRSGSTTPLADSLRTPLLHDPGARWTYGTSLDWLGLIVAAVRAQRLDTVVQERICAPCGMTSTSFDLRPDMRARRAVLHRRRLDGTLAPVTVEPPDTPSSTWAGRACSRRSPTCSPCCGCGSATARHPVDVSCRRRRSSVPYRGCRGSRSPRWPPPRRA